MLRTKKRELSKREVPQHAKNDQHCQPGPNPCREDCNPRPHVSQIATELVSGSPKQKAHSNDEHRVIAQGREQMPVKQLMQGAQRSASGAEQTCHPVEQAEWV